MRQLIQVHADLARTLWLVLTRQRDGVAPGDQAISYGKAGRLFGLVMVGVSVVEIVAVELLVPWDTVRRALFFLGAYGLLMVLAMIADASVRPHVLTKDSLRLRFGRWAEVTVPLTAVAEVRRRLAHPERPVVLAEGRLSISSDNQTQVELRLHEPLELRVGSQRGAVSVVAFSADDPAAAAAALSTQTYAGDPPSAS